MSLLVLFGAGTSGGGDALVKRWDGAAFTDAPLKRWDGAAFVAVPSDRLKYWNGSAWVPTA